MAVWQQYFQWVFFGAIFLFFLTKLFSVMFAFRKENLRITRSHPSESEPETELDPRVLEENEPLIDENVKAVNERASGISDYSGSDDDDDWQGVESTELDETFSAATAFVAATAVDRAALKVSNDVQLKLYGLYKIATEGPCSSPQPSALKMTARAKWQAWEKLGAMPPEEAMEKYIEIVTELYPAWAAGSATKKKDKKIGDASTNASAKAPMGPVFSTFVYEEEPGNDLKLDDIHFAAQVGDEDKLLKCIESGVPLDQKDSEGRTPLHWAVDRGHMNITMLLLNKIADVNAEDNEGQTALHYAAVCERFDIAEFLVKHGADTEIKDNEGNTPADLCESNCPWIQRASS